MCHYHLHHCDGTIGDGGPITRTDEKSTSNVRACFNNGFFDQVQQLDHLIDFGQGESIGFVALRAQHFGQGIAFLLLVNPPRRENLGKRGRWVKGKRKLGDGG